MAANESQALVKMSGGKRSAFLIACCLLFAGFSVNSFSMGVLLPARLAAMGAASFYPLGNALGSLGTMLSLPLVGNLCDRLGSKTVTLCGVIVQLMVCTLFAFSKMSVLSFLILFAVRSVGVGLYLSAPYSLITDVTEPAERPKYFGLLVAIGAVGNLLGPLFSGLLIDGGYPDLGWIAYFPFMAIAVPIIIALYPNMKSQKARDTRFDFSGVFLLAGGVCCVVLWLNLGGKMFDWISVVSGGLLLVGITSLFVLVRHGLRRETPSVPIRVFRYKRFTTAFICNLLLSAYSTCAVSFLVAYARQGMQISSTVSSTVTMPQTIVGAVFSAIIGRWLGNNFSRRFRPLAIVAMFLITAAMIIFCTLTEASNMMIIYAATAIGGFGMIIPRAAFTPYFQAELPSGEYRMAQGMFAFSAYVGFCIFSSFAGVIMNVGMGYHEVFLLGAVFCVVALIISFFGFRLPKETARDGV